MGKGLCGMKGLCEWVYCIKDNIYEFVMFEINRSIILCLVAVCR